VARGPVVVFTFELDALPAWQLEYLREGVAKEQPRFPAMDDIAGSVIWVRGDSWPIDTTFFAEPTEGVDPIFLYFALLKADLPKLTENSGVPGLSRDAAERHTALLPSPVAVEDFALVAEPLFLQRDRLIEGIGTLTALRDAILPKLISGKIRVPDTDDPEEVIGPAAERLAAATS
jgi:hypothetical protein